jgi:hypothetical protein
MLEAMTGTTSEQRHVLVLAGGSPHAHDFAANGEALVDLVNRCGHRTISVDHPDRAAEVLTRESATIDAVLINGLWWRMNGDAYDRWRSDHSYTTSEDWRRAITGFVAAGGGLLAMHTTPICFDDWPEWGDVVGGAWKWGVSSHPPLGPVEAQIVGDHPIVSGLPDRLTLIDEVYGGLDLGDDIDIFLEARRTPDDDLQPIGWVHTFGHGRVAYDGLGHNVASLTDPVHERLIAQSLSWVLDWTGSGLKRAPGYLRG